MFSAKYDGCNDSSSDSDSSSDENLDLASFNHNKNEMIENFENLMKSELQSHINFLTSYGSQLISKEESEEFNLFYDEKEDDENMKWMDNHFGNSKNSDATLNCPCCMTTLTTQCQRHSRIKTQYRAITVRNCSVDQLPSINEELPIKCNSCSTLVGSFDEKHKIYHFSHVLASH